MESEIDPNWDENDTDGDQSMNPRPRDESVAAINEWKAIVNKRVRNDEQRDLRELKSEFTEPWLSGAADCYSYRPYDVAELESVLRRHQFDHEVADQIVELARANIAKAQEEARAHAEEIAEFRKLNGRKETAEDEPSADR